MSEEKGQAATPALFHLIGGQPTVDALVEDFYRRMDTLEAARGIRALHPADLGPITATLKKYLAEWLGGPRHYSSERGHPMLRARHLPFPIASTERDAWMLCMNGALDARIADPVVREHIRAALSRLADWMRNRPDSVA